MALKKTESLEPYQPLLVDGVNIKTINSNSLLGGGNLIIPTYCRVVQVSPEYDSNDDTLEYPTIQEGLDMAAYLVGELGTLEFVKVVVHPGIYAESVVMTSQISMYFDEGAFIVGDNPDSPALPSDYIIQVDGALLCAINEMIIIGTIAVRDNIIQLEDGSNVILQNILITNLGTMFGLSASKGVYSKDGSGVLGFNVDISSFDYCIYSEGVASSSLLGVSNIMMGNCVFVTNLVDTGQYSFYNNSNDSGSVGEFTNCTFRGMLGLEGEDTTILLRNCFVRISDLELGGGMNSVLEKGEDGDTIGQSVFTEPGESWNSVNYALQKIYDFINLI